MLHLGITIIKRHIKLRPRTGVRTANAVHIFAKHSTPMSITLAHYGQVSGRCHGVPIWGNTYYTIS